MFLKRPYDRSDVQLYIKIFSEARHYLRAKRKKECQTSHTLISCVGNVLETKSVYAKHKLTGKPQLFPPKKKYNNRDIIILAKKRNYDRVL